MESERNAMSTIYLIAAHALHADNFLNAITSWFCLNLRIRDIRLFLLYHIQQKKSDEFRARAFLCEHIHSIRRSRMHSHGIFEAE